MSNYNENNLKISENWISYIELYVNKQNKIKNKIKVVFRKNKRKYTPRTLRCFRK